MGRVCAVLVGVKLTVAWSVVGHSSLKNPSPHETFPCSHFTLHKMLWVVLGEHLWEEDKLPARELPSQKDLPSQAFLDSLSLAGAVMIRVGAGIWGVSLESGSPGAVWEDVQGSGRVQNQKQQNLSTWSQCWRRSQSTEGQGTDKQSGWVLWQSYARGTRPQKSLGWEKTCRGRQRWAESWGMCRSRQASKVRQGILGRGEDMNRDTNKRQWWRWE